MTTTIHPNTDTRGSEVCQDTDARQVGSFRCGRCAATGRFITYVENNVPKGPGGPCFRCGGKGHHTLSDRKRNWGYEQNRRIY